MLLTALEKTGADPSREKLVEALNNTTHLDLDGMKLSFSAQSHQASSAVFLTRVRGGKAELVAQ